MAVSQPLLVVDDTRLAESVRRHIETHRDEIRADERRRCVQEIRVRVAELHREAERLDDSEDRVDRLEGIGVGAQADHMEAAARLLEEGVGRG